MNNLINSLIEIPHDFFHGNIMYAKQKIKYRCAASNHFKLINVDPSNVNYCVKPAFKNKLSRRPATYIIDGQWDQNIHQTRSGIKETDISFKNKGLINIKDYQLYRSAKRHYQEEVPWEETAYHHHMIEMTNNKNWEKNELYERYNRIDRLFESLESEGFKSQREINSKDPLYEQKPKIWPEKHDVKVAIGRDGEIILVSGRHRMILAKISNVDTIPVRVSVRHTLWQKKRYNICMSDEEAKHSNLHHPDLKEFNPR